MGIEKLQRVIWRLQTYGLLKDKDPQGCSFKITPRELYRAIAYECGTSPLTYLNNKKAMTALGWLKSYRKGYKITKAGYDEL